MQTFHVSLQQAIQQLQKQKGDPFSILIQHGSMRVEYFAPRGEDKQTPHKQDELYIINSGNASFNRNGQKVHCNQGDVLFVPAGLPHHFFNISNDFGTWVIFYGDEKTESIH